MGSPSHRLPGKTRKKNAGKAIAAAKGVSKHDRAWVAKYANRFQLEEIAKDEIQRVSSDGLCPRDVQTFLAITREVAVQKFNDEEWDADQFLAWTLKWSDVALRAHKADVSAEPAVTRELWVINMGRPEESDPGDVITVAGK